jgi:SAM-dependent methyltransferase
MSEQVNSQTEGTKIGPSATGNFANVPKPELTYENLAFIKKWTKNFYSDEELIQHINNVHDEVCANNHVFGCISQFLYLKPCSHLHPIFETNLVDRAKSANSKSSFRFLDLGCCFGQETRDILLNGIDPAQMSVTDLEPTYWEAGKKLFLDDRTPLEGSVRDYDISSIESRFGDWALPLGDLSDSADLVKGWEESFDVVMSWAVLHVLTKEQCDNMLRRIQLILKPTDAVLFGCCAGGKTATENWLRTPSGKAQRFRHDASTLTQAFREAGFKGEISIKEIDIESIYKISSSITMKGEKDPNQTFFFFTAYK